MPETCPRIHLLGSGFGQNASTSNCGTVGAPSSACAGLARSAIVVVNHTIMVFILSSERDEVSTFAAQREGSPAADRLHRLDRHHPGHRLDGAGDLGRDLEAARKLHLDLGAF